MKKYLFLSLVLAVLATAFIPAEKYTLTGTVTDDKGVPIAGAVVQIKGTSVAATADNAGNFRLGNISGKETVVVSAVGFKTHEIRLRNQRSLNIRLTALSQNLDEVVVVAYDRSGESTYTGGSTTNFTYPVSKSSPVLMGRVPGVQVRGISTFKAGYASDAKVGVYTGRPGAAANIRKPEKIKDVAYNTEGYDEIVDNPFVKSKENPVSTFSIDVDAASYSNVRRFLDNGQLPPAGAVRIEEMINYFSYNYPQPQDANPFSINLEMASCPWNNKHQLVLVGLQGKKIAAENLPPANLVFLIDVSGSMNEENKLPLVKSSMKLLVDQLRPQDKVAMVVYAGNAGLVLPPTTGDKKNAIRSAIDKLEAGGSTAGGEGILLAYKTAKENFVKDGNNRVILCTDGDFNVGVSSDDGLISLVENERKSGVYLTVLGYGMGNYQDAKMQKLADKGNGNHAYIDNLQEAKKVLVKESGGTLYTIAKDVKLQIEFNPFKVHGYRLIGYENRILAKEDFNDDNKDAGELGSGHTVTALYELIPVGAPAAELKNTDELRYQQPAELFSENSFGDELMFVKLRYKKPGEDTSKLVAFPLDDKASSFNKTSDNFRFAAAVAGFGMLLRNSKYKGSANFDLVYELAEKAAGRDSEGYRKEFLELVEKAAKLREDMGVK